MPRQSSKVVVFGAAAVAAALVSATAQAALQDRDLDGNGEVDAFYDTDLDITWLRDANVNGQMNWDSAVAWAEGFSFAGYDDWRLPTTLQPDATCDYQDGGDSYGYNCTGGEMGHLWYLELGNVAGSMTNTGSLQNLQASTYWSGTEYAAGSDHAWMLVTYDGSQHSANKRSALYAMAVRPGDAPMVPEPQTCALLLAGLGVLGAVASPQRRA